MADTSALKYTADHEWLLIDGNSAVVGITAYAAEQLGDVVFVDLPDTGDEITAGSVVGEIESTKSVGELITPVDGTVTEVNQALVDQPELINSDPFGEGWLIKITFNELPALLSLEEYSALIAQ